MIRLTLAAFAANLFATAALAHQQKAALTNVLFNERTGNLEVMHKVFVHDAEHAAKKMWGDADIISDEAQQKKFADYVRSRFELSLGGDEKINLKAVGHEIEGPHFWVYQEAPAPKGTATLTVNDKILRDFWDDQGNLVNIKRGAFRGSLTFYGSDGAQIIDMRAETPE